MIASAKREIHLKDYLRVLRKHAWLICAIFAVVTAAGAAWILTQPRVYQATATLLIDPEPPRVLNIQEVSPIGAPGVEYYQTQYEIIRSRPVLERVVQILNLKERLPEIGKAKDPVGAVQSRVFVEPKRGTRLVFIRFEDTSPVLAAEAANTIANAYLRYNLDVKLRGAQDALGWLTEQMAQLKTRVQDSSAALQNYRLKSGIMGMQEQRQITAQKIMDFNKAYLEAQAQRLSVESKLNQFSQIVKEKSAADTLLAGTQNPLIEKLRADASTLELERSKILKVYRDKHPEVLKIDAQIGQIKAQIHAEIETLLRAVQTEYRVAKAREESLLGNVNQLKREGQELSEKEMQYLALQRDLESNQQLYETVLKRLKETGMAGGLETNNVRVMEDATAPSLPVRPNTARGITIAALVGLVLGIGLAMTVEYFDTTVKSAEDVERYLGLPVIAIVPAFSVKR
ncbi:MAG: GumC family protein [Candidatus Rokubacteria bacterium]|nr:GumC family protein [Candidatus Rokubacteria bacterium]